MIQDIFGIRNNQFKYVEEAKEETFELDFAQGADEILEKNAITGFHEAGPNVDKALNAWTKEYEKISANNSGAKANPMTDIGSNLTLAMDKLPAMQDRKKKIDMHVKLASKMLTEIKSRSIDKLQDIEDEILTSRKISGENKQDLINILGL